MAEAALWGLLAASSLIVGAELALRFHLPRRTVGLIMALGVGMLIASIAFELVAPAFLALSTITASAAFLSGGLVFFWGDWYIGRLGGNRRKGRQDEQTGLGIALGTVLDGIPESAVLGMSLAGGGAVSASLLVAIWTSNIPESLGSTDALVSSGKSRRWLRIMWIGITAVSGAAAAFGYRFISNNSLATGGVVEAFAGGALLTMIADEMAPEAFERSGLLTGIATALGFVIGFALSAAE